MSSYKVLTIEQFSFDNERRTYRNVMHRKLLERTTIHRETKREALPIASVWYPMPDSEPPGCICTTSPCYEQLRYRKSCFKDCDFLG